MRSNRNYRIKWLGTKGLVKEIIKWRMCRWAKAWSRRFLMSLSSLAETKYNEMREAMGAARRCSSIRYRPPCRAMICLWAAVIPFRWCAQNHQHFSTLSFAVVAERPGIEDDWAISPALNMLRTSSCPRYAGYLYGSRKNMLWIGCCAPTPVIQVHEMQKEQTANQGYRSGVFTEMKPSVRAATAFSSGGGPYIDENVSSADFKTNGFIFLKEMYGKDVKYASARLTFRLRSQVPRWTLVVLSVVEKAVIFVKNRLGRNFGCMVWKPQCIAKLWNWP